MTAITTIVKRLSAAMSELAALLGELQALSAAGSTNATCDTEEYLSVKQLAARIPYGEQTIRNMLCAGEFEEGVHYYRKRRRVIFIWSKVEAWLRTRQRTAQPEPFVPSHHARSHQAR
jgi:hypothetical protein